jgi:hypothetical protein
MLATNTCFNVDIKNSAVKFDRLLIETAGCVQIVLRYCALGNITFPHASRRALSSLVVVLQFVIAVGCCTAAAETKLKYIAVAPTLSGNVSPPKESNGAM